MRFFRLPCFEPAELNKKLLSNLEDKNFNNCWCKIEYNGEPLVVRLLDHRDGYYAFFDYDTHKETLLPGFKLLTEDEFKLLWVGKGKDEEDEEIIFGKDKEEEFKLILNYRYDFKMTYEPIDESSDESGSGEDESVSEESGSESDSIDSEEEYRIRKRDEECSEYECSDGELELK